MNPTSFTRCSSWVCRFLFVFLAANLFLCSSSSYAIQVSYSDHCSSTVPEYALKNGGPLNLPPLPHFPNIYHKGGEDLFERRTLNQSFYLLRRKSLRLSFDKYYEETAVEGIYKLEARLLITSSYYYYNNASSHDQYYFRGNATHRRMSLKFSFMGFWSKSSKKLCMVGSAVRRSKDGKIINLGAVLKLSFDIEKPNMLTSVVSGTLESTSSVNDKAVFEPISIFGFPVFSNYSYSLVSDELEKGLLSGSGVKKSRFLSLDSSRFCSVLSGETFYFDLQYRNDCKEHQNCSLISKVGGFWPKVVTLYPIQCSEEDRKLRFLMRFQYDSFYRFDEYMDLNSTMVGEGSWVDERNQLFVVGCRILDPINHFGSSVGDCELRMSLRYPLVWTVRNHAKSSGEIWSNKTVDDLGNLSLIKLKSQDVYNFNAVAEVKYEYTELDRVKKLCEVKKVAKKGVSYPGGNFYDLRFDMSVRNSKGKNFAWGNTIPLAIGDALYQNNQLLALAPSSTVEADTNYATISEPETTHSPLNISFTVFISPYSISELSKWFPAIDWFNQRGLEISAEGEYNAETGHLCMVGCRKLLFYAGKSDNDSLDCEILVQFDFPPLNDKNGGRIEGSIQSTRAKGDSLYFDEMSMSSTSFYESVAKQSLWRMDLEVTMVLISNTLMCIFVALQLFHMKRNPETVASVSLVMLLILSVGYMIPLVLNFEAMFTDSHDKQAITFGKVKQPEANEVTVRVVTMVAFLLLIRLLQSVWSAKTREGNENNPWPSEIKSIFTSLPVYIVGGLVTLVLKWTRDNHQPTITYVEYTKHPLWDYLSCNAGLTLDFFLLPQILFNTFSSSSFKALSYPFYIGTSAIRLVPHAYDQYRAHNFPTQDFNGTYYYANPKADFYSTAWDVIIPCVVISLAVIIFLQQRHGGRCILPRRLRELELYQKVATVNDP